MIQKGKAFLVWDRRKGIIRVLSLKVRDQLRELMIGTKVIDRVCQQFPADDGGERASWFAVSIAAVSNEPWHVSGLITGSYIAASI